jgi:hypothetical protein
VSSASLRVAGEEDRCTSVGAHETRCQLLTHDDDQHVAMIKHDITPVRGFRKRSVADYRMWGEPWIGPTPGQAPLGWALTFPRVE